MSEQLPKRSDVPVELTWNLADLYQSMEDFDADKQKVETLIQQFVMHYKDHLTDAEDIVAAIADYEEILTIMTRMDQYSFLPVSVDITDTEIVKFMRQMTAFNAQQAATLSFFPSQVQQLSTDILDEVLAKYPEHIALIRMMKKEKASALSPQLEEALKKMNPVFDGYYDMYEQITSADADFGTFEANGKEYPLSFVLYEEYYMYHEDTAVRRAAYKKFNEVLAQYQNTLASAYYHHVLKEKAEATMRGFDSVFDFLLQGQEVDQELYHRQIDRLMKDFAPVMRKYITHIKEERGLDAMHYADLKIDLDPEYTPSITIEEAANMVEASVATLGTDYVQKIMPAFEERWVDFARNIGKRSGAFCSGAYDVHPYIMMSWSGLQSDAYTLIHELGHAGQGILSAENQTLLSSRPSLYLIEAPSTFHELLLSDHLRTVADSPRAERSVISKMISKTYFHNFVTHLLEAAYQREVYRLIDKGDSFGANKLNEIKHQVLSDFWGDAVELEPGSELTWMRQPHYYMGLYPYTYSAGLTIATQAYLKLKSGEMDAEQWLNFLKLGGTKEPIAAAKVAGVDIATDEALKQTIAYLDRSVDRIIALTNEMK
ncbi:oligoendopeptidase F [Allofustis seminis]|uniref:oligoendopeptidase F n=1 Tax=Allofustis seminis TaxID=166939 RepID=UPI000379E50F|nr:oligoendopeptidase F [Allofustis seminis]